MTGRRPLSTLLSLLPLLALIACRSASVDVPPPAPALDAPDDAAPPPGTRSAGPAGGPGPRAVEGALAPAAGATLAAAGWPGRWIAVSVVPGVTHNDVAALDLGAGTMAPLWSTREGGNISDWTPAPAGDRIAFRTILRLGSTVEALESITVQDLAPGSVPVDVTATDTRQARLAGFVWAPAGDAIAYGLTVGRGIDPADVRPERWELRVVGVPPRGAPAALGAPTPAAPIGDVLAEIPIDPAERVDLALLAYDPASGRAAVAETARDSGLTGALRLVDTATGAVERLPTGAGRDLAAPSPDGRRLALATAGEDGWRVESVDLATGGRVTLANLPAGAVAAQPVWSPDGRWLAWPEVRGVFGDPAARTTLRVIPARDPGAAGAAAFDLDGAMRPIAFAPGGGALLTGPVDPAVPDALAVPGDPAATAPASGLTILDLPGGTPRAVPWRPSVDTWWLGWVP